MGRPSTSPLPDWMNQSFLELSFLQISDRTQSRPAGADPGPGLGGCSPDPAHRTLSGMYGPREKPPGHRGIPPASTTAAIFSETQRPRLHFTIVANCPPPVLPNPLAAPARAALAAGKRLPPSGLDSSDQCHRCMSPLAAHASGKVSWPETHCSADSALAVASPPRTAGFGPRLLRRACPLFPPPRCLLAHPRAPAAAARLHARVDAAHGANTAATRPCRRDSSPSCPSPHLELPEHPLTPLSRLHKPATVPLPSSPEKHSPEQAEAPPSSFTCAALSTASPAKPRLSRASPSSTATHRAIPDPLPPPEPPASPPPPAHVHSSLHSSSGRTEGTVSFLVSCWCSPTTSPSFSDPDVAAATAVIDRVSGHPRPRDLAQTNRGEPLFIFPHFPGPVSPPFGRRNHAGEPRDHHSGLADGVYELVPAAEEIAQESEVNVVHVDPSPEQEYRFEPEGKPRSIT
ncbi:hypothetical protein HU200_048912 [Digitaria exilis]|uniref:Uncharacterized protein n=1 Tax=Digitaria exilis TaxID=1010633 RepID=A0A835AUF3_9POAL|nr:hypothetical protein HU200_048912 [Digitaria exilis]